MCSFSWFSSLRIGGWVAGMRDCFWKITVDVGDWTSLQVGDLLGFVEPSCVWSGWWPDKTWNNIVWFSTALCIFSLIIVKSLQLHRCRKIARPHKYYPVHVIFFLWPTFSLFCFSQVWEFCVNFPTLALALAFILNYSWTYLMCG